MPLNCTCKNAEVVNFRLYVFSHYKKKINPPQHIQSCVHVNTKPSPLNSSHDITIKSQSFNWTIRSWTTLWITTFRGCQLSTTKFAPTDHSTVRVSFFPHLLFFFFSYEILVSFSFPWLCVWRHFYKFAGHGTFSVSNTQFLLFHIPFFNSFSPLVTSGEIQSSFRIILSYKHTWVFPVGFTSFVFLSFLVSFSLLIMIICLDSVLGYLHWLSYLVFFRQVLLQ